ncbi:MAG: archease [Gemmatimonadaceae bacterium]
MSASSRTAEHVGEWLVELRGDTLAAIFEELARVIARAAGPAGRSHEPPEDLDVEARDQPALLVDYANELVSRSEIGRRAYDDVREIEIRDEPTPRIRARIRGRPVKSWRSPLKAATYHGIVLAKDAEGWRARILFDV